MAFIKIAIAIYIIYIFFIKLHTKLSPLIARVFIKQLRFLSISRYFKPHLTSYLCLRENLKISLKPEMHTEIANLTIAIWMGVQLSYIIHHFWKTLMIIPTFWQCWTKCLCRWQLISEIPIVTNDMLDLADILWKENN